MMPHNLETRLRIIVEVDVTNTAPLARLKLNNMLMTEIGALLEDQLPPDTSGCRSEIVVSGVQGGYAVPDEYFNRTHFDKE